MYKPIKPQFLYDKNGKPLAATLTIDEYQSFMSYLEKLSNEARNRELAKKSKQRKAK